MRDIQAKPSGSIPPTSQDGEGMFAVGMEIPYRAQKGPIHSFRVRLRMASIAGFFFFEYISHPPTTILYSLVRFPLIFQIDFLSVY